MKMGAVNANQLPAKKPHAVAAGTNGEGYLKSLPDEKRAMVDALIVRNYSPARVARWMLQHWPEVEGVSESSLTRAVQRYKKETLLPLMAIQADVVDPKAKARIAAAVSHFDDHVDVSGTLGNMIRMQSDRMAMLHARELENNEPDSRLDKAMDQMGRMLNQASDLQFDLGIMKRAPKKVVADLNVSTDTAGEEVYKARKALTEIKKQTMAECLTLTQDSTGEFSLAASPEDAEPASSD